MLFAGAALVTGIAIMALVPWGKGLARTDENYYTVILNGNEIGNVSDVAIAENAYAQARIRLEEEWKDGVYVDGTLSLVENHAWRGAATEQNILEDKIYQELSKSVVDVQQTVYTLSVGDVSVVLSSLEEVAEVVDSVKDIYEAGDDYQTVITESDSERFGTATCELVQASIEPENRPMVMASGDGTVDESGNAETDVVSFGNDIEIVETYAEETVSVEEAVSMIKDALQVVSVKEETYTEEIAYSVEYVYDDSMYSDSSEIVQEGQAGSREVTAEVTYQNGVEIQRTVLDSVVTAEPVSQIIKVGTESRPEFAFPLSNPRISDVYGPRWGRMHWGMDFSCSIGTDVMASAGGTVVEAAYRSDYGYTVVIAHDNGMETRYAHMSCLLVSEGNAVSQGDVIGLSGNTGDSTGPHLHFEIIDSAGNRINPADYLYK